MTTFLRNTNWLLIFSLVIGSSILAVLGDSVGSKYGKKRISLFGLRPKHTSRLITALTGALIAVGILTITSAISRDVRTALFGMKLLRQEMYKLQFQLTQSENNAAQMKVNLAEASASLDLTGLELDSIKNETVILEQQKKELEATLRIMREESESLKREIKSLKSETVAINANSLLGQTAFEPGLTPSEIVAGLNQLKREVRLDALEKISNQSFSNLRDVQLEFDSYEEAKLIVSLASSDIRQYVRALSAENYTIGENSKLLIRYETGTSIIIYPEGSPVYRKFFMNDRENSSTTAEGILHTFLRELKNNAIKDGILPEPSTNNVGTLDGEAFFAAVDNLSKITGPVIINAIASQDIYTEGPIIINISFEE